MVNYTVQWQKHHIRICIPELCNDNDYRRFRFPLIAPLCIWQNWETLLCCLQRPWG